MASMTGVFEERLQSCSSPIRGMAGWMAFALFTAMLSACGGGGGTSSVSAPSPPQPPLPAPPHAPSPSARAADATVRAFASEVHHTSPAGHPRPATTIYRAETLEPATNPRTAGSWETSEYHASTGLPLIRASTGYAARTTGQPGGGGRTIAIVDTKIPVDDGESVGHPDLQGVKSVDVSGQVVDIDHGTRVAGIAAARRNGWGVHGVAYNANIVGLSSGDETKRDFEAIMASIAGLTGSYGASDRKWDSRPEASAHVGNFSLGLRRPEHDLDPVKRGMRLMAREGRVMVAAAGNDGEADPSTYPAVGVTDEGVAGWAMAVGALDATGEAAASWSNRCGKVKRWCLFAPGTDINSTQGAYHDASRDHGPSEGTSAASPYVAGAVAAVWGAFPNKTGRQVVDRILDTARQVDPANGAYDADGLSAIYGHGALDLGAAMNPVGFTSLVVGGSGAAPVRRSFVSLPPGFRHRPTAALGDAIVYDTQMFPFLHDLNGAVRAYRWRSAASAVDDFLSLRRYVRWPSRPGRRTRLELAESKQDRIDRDRSDEIGGHHFRVAATPALSFRFGPSFGVRGVSNDFVARRLGRGLFREGFVVGPFTELVGKGAALGVDWRRDEHTRLDFVGKAGSGYFGDGRAWLASFGVTRGLGAGLRLGARYGALRERGSLLGIRGSGAFRGASGGHTDFVDLGVELQVASGPVFFGSVGRGLTKSEPGGAGSLITGWSGGRGESFALGGEWSDVWRDTDRLTLSASSPLRPRGAGMYVDVPDRELADGVVAYTRHWVDLSPRGREVRLQLVYETHMAPGAALTLGSFLRLQPDHDPRAASEYGAAAKLRVDF